MNDRKWWHDDGISKVEEKDHLVIGFMRGRAYVLVVQSGARGGGCARSWKGGGYGGIRTMRPRES